MAQPPQPAQVAAFAVAALLVIVTAFILRKPLASLRTGSRQGWASLAALLAILALAGYVVTTRFAGSAYQLKQCRAQLAVELAAYRAKVRHDHLLYASWLCTEGDNQLDDFLRAQAMLPGDTGLLATSIREFFDSLAGRERNHIYGFDSVVQYMRSNRQTTTRKSLTDAAAVISRQSELTRALIDATNRGQADLRTKLDRGTRTTELHAAADELFTNMHHAQILACLDICARMTDAIARLFTAMADHPGQVAIQSGKAIFAPEVPAPARTTITALAADMVKLKDEFEAKVKALSPP